MTEETRGRVVKAENDWLSLNRNMSWPMDVDYDDVCFHAQQYIEKYIKARLIEADIVFPKTHALDTLLALVLPVEPTGDELRPRLSELTAYGVKFRYPRRTAAREDAEEAH